MMFFAAMLFFGFGLDCAKTCKPVNYKYKQHKVEQYDYGCKKGCFGHANITNEPYHTNGSYKWEFDEYGRKADGDHYVQDTCVECKTIDANLIIATFKDRNSSPTYPFPNNVSVTINNTELEKACNGLASQVVVVDDQGKVYYQNSEFVNRLTTCFWNSKKSKCGANSCPHKKAMLTCIRMGGNWTDGKCAKREGINCDLNYIQLTTPFPGTFMNGNSFYLSDVEKTTTRGCADTLSNGTLNYVQTNEYFVDDPNYRWVTCDDLDKYYHSQNVFSKDDFECVKFTSDHVKECKYKCENPNKGKSTEKYEYTKRNRKECHRVYGCLYANASTCSTWSVWAFVLTLIILILVVVGAVVGFLIVAHFVLKLF